MSTAATAVAHDASCIFCKIIKGDIPSFKLIETSHSYSFLDINPIADAHVLIIPKYHGAKLHNVPDEYLADILPVTKKLAKAIGCDQDGPGGAGYNILQNNGRIAHQLVDHVHFHLIPKKDLSTGLGVNWPMRPTDLPKLKQLHEQLTEKLTKL